MPLHSQRGRAFPQVPSVVSPGRVVNKASGEQQQSAPRDRRARCAAAMRPALALRARGAFITWCMHAPQWRAARSLGHPMPCCHAPQPGAVIGANGDKAAALSVEERLHASGRRQQLHHPVRCRLRGSIMAERVCPPPGWCTCRVAARCAVVCNTHDRTAWSMRLVDDHFIIYALPAWRTCPQRVLARASPRSWQRS